MAFIELWDTGPVDKTLSAAKALKKIKTTRKKVIAETLSANAFGDPDRAQSTPLRPERFLPDCTSNRIRIGIEFLQNSESDTLSTFKHPQDKVIATLSVRLAADIERPSPRKLAMEKGHKTLFVVGLAPPNLKRGIAEARFVRRKVSLQIVNDRTSSESAIF